jgi:hypothetical protein
VADFYAATPSGPPPLLQWPTIADAFPRQPVQRPHQQYVELAQVCRIERCRELRTLVSALATADMVDELGDDYVIGRARNDRTCPTTACCGQDLGLLMKRKDPRRCSSR